MWTGRATMRDGSQAPAYSAQDPLAPLIEKIGKPAAEKIAGVAGKINRTGQGLWQSLLDAEAERTGNVSSISTDYDPRNEAIRHATDLASTVTMAPSVTGGVPAGALGSAAKGLFKDGLPVKGAKYTKESRKVLDEIQAGPKGAGPMNLTGDLRSDVPQIAMERTVPPRGVSPRLQDALNNPAVERGVSESIEKGIGLGADKWYHNEPVRQSFIKELGPVQGPKDYSQFMDMVAATSPRSDVPTNIRNASFYYSQAGNKLPEKLPYPYGHVAQNLHRQNYETLTAPRPGALSADAPMTTAWDIFKNPKPASFSQNLQGNLEPGTMDTHAFRNIGMRTNDPRFLETSVSAKYKQGSDPTKDTIVNRFGERRGDTVTFRPQRLHEEGKLPLSEALNIPYFWTAKPNANEYGAAEKFYSRLGRDFKLPTADAQAAAWSGGGNLTGLGTVATHTFPQLLNERILYTAKMRGENPSETLSKFIKREAPLLGLGGGGAALSPSLFGGDKAEAHQ
jgi:hypothetical protein